MITERTIINALIIGASLIAAPYIISSALELDYIPGLVFGTVGAIFLTFFYLKEKLCMFPMLGGAIAGSMNFLPLPLKACHIFSLLLILYFITGYVIIRQRKIRLGPPKFLWPIAIITLILLFHNHSVNVGVLGGSTEGAKPAIMIYIVVLAYFCGLNIATPSVSFISKIPFLFFLLSLISSIPYVLTTYFPSLAPFLFTITDKVNVDAYLTSVNSGGSAGTESGIGRLMVFGPVGMTLQVCLLAYFPIGTWLRPDRLWVLGLSIFCLLLTIAGGYRSGIFDYLLFIFSGAFCYYSWRSLFLPVFAAIILLVVLIAANNNLIQLPTKSLPLTAQRTLSFLPGDWDEEAIKSGESSNAFRQNIKDVYIKEYMDKSPFFGNGFTINTKDYTYYQSRLTKGGSLEANAYVEAKTFIEGKLYHTGWISVYDCVGIIGSIAFVILGINQIGVTGHFIFGKKADRRSTLYPLYVWIFCNMTTMMISFFTVFGDFAQTFSDLCMYALVLAHLINIERTREIPIVLSTEKKGIGYNELITSGYGYQSKH